MAVVVFAAVVFALGAAMLPEEAGAGDITLLLGVGAAIGADAAAGALLAGAELVWTAADFLLFFALAVLAAGAVAAGADVAGADVATGAVFEPLSSAAAAADFLLFDFLVAVVAVVAFVVAAADLSAAAAVLSSAAALLSASAAVLSAAAAFLSAAAAFFADFFLDFLAAASVVVSELVPVVVACALAMAGEIATVSSR